MVDRPDLLVIGGGITGQCAALVAAQAGARVALVDLGRNAGSHTNAGSLHVQMQSRFLRLNPHLADNLESSLPLYLAAVGEWERLEQALGGVEMTRGGGLMLAESGEQLAFLERKAAREARQGLSVELLDRAALERLAPYLGDSIIGAELCRDEGKLDPLIANRRMAAALAAQGVVLRHDRITAVEDGAHPAAVGDSRHEAGQILLAAAWSTGALAQAAGLALPTPSEPLHMNITEPGHYAIRHLVQHAERSITLKQFRSGQVVIGGGWPARGAPGDAPPRVLARSILGNVALAGRIAPGIAGLRVLRAWAGYNTSVDGKATIGPARPGGRIHLALPGDAGYTLGPIVGRAAATLALGLEPPFDTAPYSPMRWRT